MPQPNPALPPQRPEGPLQPSPQEAVVTIQPTASYAYPNAARDEGGLNFRQVWQILVRRYRLFLLVAVSVTGLVWAKTLLETPLYEGRFKVLVEDVNKSQPPLPTEVAAGLPKLEDADFATIVDLMQSDTLLMPVARELRQTGSPKAPSLSDLQTAVTSQQLAVTRIDGTKILEITYRNPSREQARKVLEVLARNFVNYSLTREQQKLNQGIRYLEQQFPGLQARVDRLESQLEQFRRNYSFIDPDKQGEALLNSVSTAQETQRDLARQLSQAEANRTLLQRQVGLMPERALAAASLSESPRYQSLLNDLLELDKKIALESARVQPDNPTLLTLKDKRAQLLPLLKQESAKLQGQGGSAGRPAAQLTQTGLGLTQKLIENANLVRSLRQQQAVVAAQQAQIDQQFQRYPALARQYQGLLRELEVAQTNLKNFIEAREKFRLEAAQKTVPWELINQPEVGLMPVSPNIPRNFALGLVVGLVAGAGAALLRDRFDHVYHSPEEVKVELPQIPLLAAIPHIAELKSAPEALPGVTAVLPPGTEDTTTATAESDPSANRPRRGYYYRDRRHLEAFRSLYTNLQFLSADTPIRAIAIGSSMASEGKSTISRLLASTAVSMGKRVLVVDADLRKPQVHKRFGVDNLVGLSNLLAGEANLTQVLQEVEPGLWVVTAGQRPPDPIRLLASERMQELSSYFKTCGEFDLVIYDTPPLLGMADTSALASEAVDGVILVISLGRADRKAPKEVIAQLRFGNIPLLGVVTNALREETHAQGLGYYQYNYYSYYRGYGDDEPQRPQATGWRAWLEKLLASL